ncbi:MAG: glycosyltransferase [Marmoricola sp.]
MGDLASHILTLPVAVVLAIVFLLPALESSAFIGFIFPGEIALILGGVVASQGRVPVLAVLAAGIGGAILGDSVGYAVGSRFGRGLLDGTVGRFVKPAHLDRAEAYLAERGGKAVFFGRFTAALRVLIPGLAGMSGLRYRTFLFYNVSSAVGWGVLSVMLGYLGGNNWRHVEHIASRLGLAALALVAVGFLSGFVLRRFGTRRIARSVSAVTSCVVVQRTLARFPRTSRWLGRRLDPSDRAGLGLTVAIAVAIAATWMSLGVTQDVLGHEELALLDPRIHTWVDAHRAAGLNTFFSTATWLGAIAVTVPLLAIVGGVLARRRRSLAPVLDILVVYLGAVSLHTIVGLIAHRGRPPAADWIAPAGGWAYPSGHTSQAVAAWGIIALLVAARSTPRTRVLVGLGAATIVAVVGLSRVYLGVHWATDVLGGVAMSTAVLATWSTVRRTFLSPRATPCDIPGRPTTGFSRLTPQHRSLAMHSLTNRNRLHQFRPPQLQRTVVVIPTYNEAGNVTAVLERVRQETTGVDVLVVDDNSPDGTADLVKVHPAYVEWPLSADRSTAGAVFLLSRTTKDGLGGAYRAGFAWALERDYDAVVQMDADLSHPADRIPALLRALDTADMAVGSRYTPGGGVSNWSPSRRLISWAGNHYVRLVLGLPVHDTTAGFKAFRRGTLESIGVLDSVSNGYCFQIENTWRVVRLGLSVREVPITFVDRTVGTSKMSGSIAVEALIRVLVWRWREFRHHDTTSGQGASQDQTQPSSARRRGGRHVAA